MLYLITFVTSIPALYLFQPVLDDPAGYVAGGGDDNRIFLGVTLELLLIAANIGTALVPYPLLKRQNEGLALGYVAARIVECTFILVGILAILSVVTLQQEDAGGDEGAIAYTFAALKDWTFLLGPGVVVGIGNGLMLGYLMYRSELVPPRAALLGLIGGPLIIVSGIAVLFGVDEPSGPLQGIATIPGVPLGAVPRRLLHRLRVPGGSAHPRGEVAEGWGARPGRDRGRDYLGVDVGQATELEAEHVARQRQAAVGERVGGQNGNHRRREAREHVGQHSCDARSEVSLLDVVAAQGVGELVGRHRVGSTQGQHCGRCGDVEGKLDEHLRDVTDVDRRVPLCAGADHRDRLPVPGDERRGARPGLVRRPVDERRAHDCRPAPTRGHELLCLTLRAEVVIARYRVGAHIAQEHDALHRRAGKRGERASDGLDVCVLVGVAADRLQSPRQVDDGLGIREQGGEIAAALDEPYLVRAGGETGLDVRADVPIGTGDHDRPGQASCHRHASLVELRGRAWRGRRGRPDPHQVATGAATARTSVSLTVRGLRSSRPPASTMKPIPASSKAKPTTMANRAICSAM